MASESSPSPRSPGTQPPSSSAERRIVRLGKYEVFQHIATGGMGAVYRARDTESGGEVALKVLPPELAAKKGMLERFKREARSAAKLHHENIVKLLESGDINGTFYLAMEFVEGVDLHDHVKKLGPLDPEDARQIILQGARALKHADEFGIIHRDIKPSNFLLTRKNGRLLVKLLDFGLAREVDADEFRVTRAGTTVGTVDYMSPEQARDSGAADIRSDLYSLGCTWYHLLAGRAPFPDGGLGERLIKIMHEEPPDLRDLNPLVSDDTWEVVQALLAKHPDDRFQTPDELITALEALHGRSQARRTTRSEKPATRKTRSAPPPPTAARTPTPTLAPRGQRDSDDTGKKSWHILAGLAVVLLLGGVIVAISMPRNRPELDPEPPPIVPGDGGTAGPQGGGLMPLPIRPSPRVTPVPVPPPINITVPPVVEVKQLRALSPSVRLLNLTALRAEVEKPWSDFPSVAPETPVARLGRAVPLSPLGFRSLADACKAGEPGKPLIIEIHDNGPLFELPADTIEGRDLVLRAGPGYRPLIVWDIPATLARHPRKPDQPLVFFPFRKGRLLLQGIELAIRWPESVTLPATLLDLQQSELTVRDCTFSAAGKPPAGITLARFSSTQTPARLRFTRCHLRGTGWNALTLDAPEADILYDSCLLVGGQSPLLRLTIGPRRSTLRIVRSTLVAASTLLELKPVSREASPSFAWFGWDSLLSCSGSTNGTFVSLLDGADTRNMQWRAANCLYAGWKHLLRGATNIDDDHAAWQRNWAGVDTDALASQQWPDQIYNEPASLAPSAYLPTGSVLYGASVAMHQPLGCPLDTLPPARDTWLATLYDPTLSPPELLSDDSPPTIPTSEDGTWTGGSIDLASVDLGAELNKLHAAKRLAPHVVLHLRGKGEHRSSPIRLKGVRLTLHFEEPADKDSPPLTLVLSRGSTPLPLIDLDGGGLDIIGGILRVPDQPNFAASHVVRVRGDVRLFRTRLEGAQLSTPEGFQATLTILGSGDPAPDKSHSLAIHESVLLSARTAIAVEGIGTRLNLAQSLIVSGGDALLFAPGKECTTRVATQAIFSHVTFAARRAVVSLEDVPANPLPLEPIQIRARDCAYLNPFPGRPNKAGLLAWNGDALPRGLLLWRGEREGYDTRLHFSAASLLEGISDTREGLAPWKQLWGSSGIREPREFSLLPVFDARRWPLERLIVKMRQPPGANLDRLGIAPRKPMPPR